MNEQFEMIAKTFQGLEEILAEELTALGANDIQIGRRMVSFTGDKRMMYKANSASVLLSVFLNRSRTLRQRMPTKFTMKYRQFLGRNIST